MTDKSHAPLSESLSEDFALSDSDVGQGLISDLPSDIDEPTVEEIEEWAKVDSPAAVRSVPSSHSDRDINEQSALEGIDEEPVASVDPPPTEAVLKEAMQVAAQLSSSEPAPNFEDKAKQLTSKEVDAESIPKAQSHEISPQQQQAGGSTTPSSAAAWGWNSGWGWDKLRQVAVEAVKDVSELKESFQQVLHEVVVAESDEEDQAATAVRYPSPAKPEPEVEVRKKSEILQRLEGPDTQLEVGLKAIDDQVEQLATGAAKALGSLWGGIAGVAKRTITEGQSLVGKVETATLELAKELVQSVEEGVKDVNSGLKGVSELGTTLATRAERGLESIGRNAIGLLEEVAGPGGPSQRGFRDGAGTTFDQCFHSYGGRRAYEELEALSNECAQLCNRSRARLDADGKAKVDKILQELTPLFDLLANAAAALPAPTPTDTPSTTDDTTASAPDVEQLSEGQAATTASPTSHAEPDTAPEPSTKVPSRKGAKRSVESQLATEYQPVSELHQAALESMKQLLQWAEDQAAAAEKRAQEAAQKLQQKQQEGEGAGSNGAGPSSTDVPTDGGEASSIKAGSAAPAAATDAPAAAAEEPAAKESSASEAAAAPSGTATEGSVSTEEARVVKDKGKGKQAQAEAVSSEDADKDKDLGLVIVSTVRKEGMRRLAEVCATEVQLLLRLGRSIAAPARYGRPADDGIQWPAPSTGKAGLLQQTAQRMSADIESAADDFLSALNTVGELVAAKLLDEKAAQRAEVCGSDLEVDCGTAAARIQEGFRNLLYVVTLSSLHAEGLLVRQ